MAEKTKISWCHHTANFWWGCSRAGAGCVNCYAEKTSERHGKQLWGNPKNSVRERKKAIWEDIKKWDKAARAKGEYERVFVSSMCDFLEDHPMVNEWREEAKLLLANLMSLDVLLLTKRPQNAKIFLYDWLYDWPVHVWFGMSVSEQKDLDCNIGHLFDAPAKIHFLSLEPMLEKIDLHNDFGLEHIDWVIVGGESGSNRRPFDWDWARDIRDQCRAAGVYFYMKQGAGNSQRSMPEIPKDLKIREYPK